MSLMRGVYITRLDLSQLNLLGVKKKVWGQKAALARLLGPVDVYHLQGAQVVRNSSEVVRDFSRCWMARRYAYYVGFFRSLAGLRLDPSYVYIRYPRCCPFFLYMLYRFRKDYPKAPILLEIPTYPYEQEAVSRRERALILVDRMTRWLLRYLVDRVVTFHAHGTILGIPTILTQNGIDLSELPVVPLPQVLSPFRILGVANLSFWHGYDRIIAGLAAYKQNSDPQVPVVFEVVGQGAEFEPLRSLARRLGVKDRVHFHGPLYGNDLDQIILRSHVTVASLGMHRLGVSAASLKSREFCARGIPFIMSADDIDFPWELPFICRVPPTDDPIDIAKVVSFYKTLRLEYPRFNRDMRAYAEAHLTWDVKLAPVAEEIRKLQVRA